MYLLYSMIKYTCLREDLENIFKLQKKYGNMS